MKLLADENIPWPLVRLDSFNVLERLPCERCIYKRFKLCRYALTPMRFAGSATMLRLNSHGCREGDSSKRG